MTQVAVSVFVDDVSVWCLRNVARADYLYAISYAQFGLRVRCAPSYCLCLDRFATEAIRPSLVQDILADLRGQEPEDNCIYSQVILQGQKRSNRTSRDLGSHRRSLSNMESSSKP